MERPMDNSPNSAGPLKDLLLTGQQSAQARRFTALGGVAEIAPDRGHTGFTRAIRAMHWTSITLCLGAFLLAWAIGNAAIAESPGLVMLHRSLVVTILALSALHLAWRPGAPVQPLPVKAPAFSRFANRAFAMGIYVLLTAQLLMGVTACMLNGARIVVFGAVEVPSFISENEPLARQISEVRGWVALLLMALIGVHLVGALRERFIHRDDGLAGILRGLRRQDSPKGVTRSVVDPPRRT
jgi:cytochrome b561